MIEGLSGLLLSSEAQSARDMMKSGFKGWGRHSSSDQDVFHLPPPAQYARGGTATESCDPGRELWFGWALERVVVAASCKTIGMTLLLQWLQKVEHLAQKDDFWALSYNGICSIGFWTYLGSVTLFFLFPHFRMRMFILCLSHHFGSIYLVRFHRFTTGEEFCLRINWTSCLTLILFRWYLEDTLGFKLRVDARLS